ncbi:MAG: PAS domain S-box protein [Patescibacteria group bacterium]
MTDKYQSIKKLEEENKKLKIEVGLLNGGYFQLKKTTEQLRESEEKFLKAFETSPYAIVITRVKDNKLIDVNRSFIVISGFTKEEAIANSSIGLHLWVDIRNRDKIISDLKKGIEIKDREFEFKKKNGEIIIGSFSAKLLNIGKEPCIISSISDITERKKLERMLRERQDMLEKAETIANLGSYSFEIEKGVWSSSKELDKIFGINNKYVHSFEGWSNIVIPEEREIMINYFNKEVLGAHHPFDKEYNIIRQTDKAVRLVHGTGQLEFNKQNIPVKMFGTIQDITERKQIDLKLAQKNRALKMVGESNQALIHATDEQKLLNKICQIIVEIGNYHLAWIGLVENDKSKIIRPIAQAGYDADYVKSIKLTWDDTERGRGPGGIAARTGKPSMVKDILTDPSMAPWRKDALKQGYRSVIFLPLFNEGVTFGVLGIYSKNINAFDKEELDILNEFTGDLSFGIATIRTRTENVKIQEALVVSEAKYRSLFENARDGLIIIDAKTGEIREVNYYLIELLGYGPNKFLRKKLWQINLFKDIINSQKAFDTLKNQKYKRFENIPIKTGEGKTIYVEFVSNIYPSKRSGVLQCNIRDITERHNLEEQVMQSEKRYSTLVESSNDAVILVQDGLIKYANHAISDIINLSPNDVIGKPMVNFIDPKYHDLITQNYKNRILGNKVESRYEFAVINGHGETVPVETNSSLISFEGRPASMSVIRDISRAKEVDRIKSDFISVASHQLRTPLTGIKWFSQLLINQKIGKLSKKQTDFIAQIYNSNERMIRLVNDLLDVSHIESGQKFNIEKKPSDVINLINNVIKDQKLNTPNKKITIKLDSNCPKKLDFAFDADKIYQVFSNLISNSIKYSEQQAKIIIGATCSVNEAQFFVKDFGLGIPNNQKDRVFQKFFRADNISTISTEGTGLGLYIVKGIIEAHGGKVWFDSKQNEGTTFYFTLPLKS